MLYQRLNSLFLLTCLLSISSFFFPDHAYASDFEWFYFFCNVTYKTISIFKIITIIRKMFRMINQLLVK